MDLPLGTEVAVLAFFGVFSEAGVAGAERF